MGAQAFYMRVKGWATAPFSTQLDLMSFVLFTVLAVTLSYMWSRVLRHTFEG